MSYSADPVIRAQFIGDLRALASFLSRHPAVPVPDLGADITLHAPSTDDGGRDEVNHIARLLGARVIDDTPDGGHYIAERHFGQVRYRAVSIPASRMALHQASASYYGCVIPDTP